MIIIYINVFIIIYINVFIIYLFTLIYYLFIRY